MDFQRFKSNREKDLFTILKKKHNKKLRNNYIFQFFMINVIKTNYF